MQNQWSNKQTEKLVCACSDVSSFCGECYHQSLITRERKDPANPSYFLPICEECNDAYILKQVIFPFCRNAEKLRNLASNKESDYTTLSNAFSKVYGEIVNKNQMVPKAHNHNRSTRRQSSQSTESSYTTATRARSQ